MQVKFITLNIWLGGKLFESSIDFLKKEDPDILALQEAYNGIDPNIPKNFRTVFEIKQALNFPFHSYSPKLMDLTKFGKIQIGNAIFSKFNIEFNQTFFFDIPYRQMNTSDLSLLEKVPAHLQHSLIKLNEETQVNVFNLHGIWGRDGLDNERRDKMIDLIISKILNQKNVLLAGDFNLDQYTNAVSRIEKNFHNVFGRELRTTFNLKQKKDKKYSQAVVDMIFINFKIKVLKHYAPQVDVSDHIPLVAILEL